jgi:acetyl-CoA carboxylase biotin carboxyl carrier protein
VSLTAQDVAQITRLLEESSFDELDLELDGLKLSIRRGSSANVQPVVGPAGGRSPAAGPTTPGPAATTPASGAVTRGSRPSAPASAPAEVTDPNTLTDPNTPADPSTLTVLAPLLGTFYRAPKPGAAPFVEIGSHVEEDTIVGIIEVMKLMNTVRAGARGKVIQILGRDGALVEYGEPLLRLSKMS